MHLDFQATKYDTKQAFFKQYNLAKCKRGISTGSVVSALISFHRCRADLFDMGDKRWGSTLQLKRRKGRVECLKNKMDGETAFTNSILMKSIWFFFSPLHLS